MHLIERSRIQLKAMVFGHGRQIVRTIHQIRHFLNSLIIVNGFAREWEHFHLARHIHARTLIGGIDERAIRIWREADFDIGTLILGDFIRHENIHVTILLQFHRSHFHLFLAVRHLHIRIGQQAHPDRVRAGGSQLGGIRRITEVHLDGIIIIRTACHRGFFNLNVIQKVTTRIVHVDGQEIRVRERRIITLPPNRVVLRRVVRIIHDDVFDVIVELVEELVLHGLSGVVSHERQTPPIARHDAILPIVIILRTALRHQGSLKVFPSDGQARFDGRIDRIAPIGHCKRLIGLHPKRHTVGFAFLNGQIAQLQTAKPLGTLYRIGVVRLQGILARIGLFTLLIPHIPGLEIDVVTVKVRKLRGVLVMVELVTILET